MLLRNSVEILKSRYLTYFLLATITATSFVLLFAHASTTVQAETIAEVMYYVPEDSSQIDAKVLPALLQETGTQQVGNTTDWETIERLFSENSLEGLIIHHESLHSVNASQLYDIFMAGIPVVGIGVHGKHLADTLGLPGLYTTTWNPEFNYTTPNFYFMYSVSVKGDSNDIARIDLNRYIEIQRAETDAHKAELEQISLMLDGRPFSLRVKASTDSLNGTITDVLAMKQVLKNHIKSTLSVVE